MTGGLATLPPTCSVEGCASPSSTRGWCQKHWAHEIIDRYEVSE